VTGDTYVAWWAALAAAVTTRCCSCSTCKGCFRPCSRLFQHVPRYAPAVRRLGGTKDNKCAIGGRTEPPAAPLEVNWVG